MSVPSVNRALIMSEKSTTTTTTISRRDSCINELLVVIIYFYYAVLVESLERVKLTWQCFIKSFLFLIE